MSETILTNAIVDGKIVQLRMLKKTYDTIKAFSAEAERKAGEWYSFSWLKRVWLTITMKKRVWING